MQNAGLSRTDQVIKYALLIGLPVVGCLCVLALVIGFGIIGAEIIGLFRIP